MILTAMITLGFVAGIFFTVKFQHFTQKSNASFAFLSEPIGVSVEGKPLSRADVLGLIAKEYIESHLKKD